MHITTQDINGVFSIMPTPALPTAEDPLAVDTVDHVESARAVESLIADGVDAVMANGTLGEGATLTWDEHRAFAETVVATAAGRVPVFLGATTLNTRDTISRARALAAMGADGLLLGRPMWSPCDDAATVSFYRAVAEAVPELAIIIYDNPISFRGKISPGVYAQLATIPQIVATKYPVMGPSFLADLEAMGGAMKILPLDRDWYYAWRWLGDEISACWSGGVSCGPGAVTALRDRLRDNDADGAEAIAKELRHAGKTFYPKGSFELFSTYNVQLEKIRINEAGYIAAGPCRPPYTYCPDEYAEGARESGRRLAALHAKYARAGSGVGLAD